MKQADLTRPQTKALLNQVHSKHIVLPPQARSISHHHHEMEIWHIISGIGKVITESDRFQVTARDTITFQPLQNHVIENLSQTQELYFIALWWHDFEKLNKAMDIRLKATKKINKNIFILPSFPTPNGSLHLGHLAGPYIAADAYKRYQKMMGNQAVCLLGTLGYQSQVACQGQKLNLSFHETAQKYSHDIEETLLAAHIFPDIFLNPDTTSYKNITQAFFTQICQQGHLQYASKNALYCETCKKYLFEAHVSGICPYCHHDGASSNECESCGYLHEDEALANAHCKSCHQPATLKPLSRFYFPLEPFREKLQLYYQNIEMSPRLKTFIDQVFQSKLIAFPVSHVDDYGIPLPLADYNQRIYSLFELVPRYLCAIQASIQKYNAGMSWEKIIHRYTTILFFGFDNAYLRTIIFPALLMAYDPSFPLPQAYMSNEFYRLEDKKFSTSRHHAIWGKELLKNYSSDLVRFYLAYTRPEHEQTNFTESAFKSFIHKHFISTLEPWLQALGLRLTTYYADKVPEAGLWNEEALSFYEEINFLSYKIRQSYQSTFFSLSKAAHYLLTLIKRAQQFGQTSETLCKANSLKNEARTQVSLELMAARSLSILAFPLMPNFSTLLWQALGQKEDLGTMDPEVCLAFIPQGQEITQLNQVYFSNKGK